MRRKLSWFFAVGIASAALYGGTLLATPGSGFSGKTLVVGRFAPFDLNSFTPPADTWHANLKTRGDSDLYVQSNTWAVGGTTGWHTHPGPSFITITAGAVTVYDADDPTCTPHTYSAGETLVDAGGDHVHLIRNGGTVEAQGYAVQLVPAGAVRRIDAPNPGTCGF